MQNLSLRKFVTTIAGALVLVSSNLPAVEFNLDEAEPSAKYAKETLVTTGAIDEMDTETMHYLLGGPSHTAIGELGVGVANDRQYRIRFELSGLVFTAVPTLEINRPGANVIVDTSAASTPTGGGAIGYDYAEWTLTAPSGGLRATDVATLGNAAFAIDRSGVGSISLSMRGEDIFAVGGFSSNVVTFRNAVSLVNAIDETVMANDAEVKADSNFTNFGVVAGSPIYEKNVGNVMLGVDDTLLAAGTGVAMLELYGLITADNASDLKETDIVMIDGDFSFVTNAELHTNVGCNTVDANVTDSSLVTRDEDGVVTEVKPVGLDEFLVPAGLYLCLTLSDEDDASSVPRTAPYTATFSYVGSTMRSSPLQGLHTGWAASRATGPQYTCRI